MRRPVEDVDCVSPPPPAPRSLWITLEAPEVIELKRIAMDRDGDSAVAFFRDEVVPRVRAAGVGKARAGMRPVGSR